MEVRKLVTKDEVEKKRSRNRIWVGATLVFLMVASTLGFALQGQLGTTTQNQGEDKVTYNEFDFVNRNGFWVLGNLVFSYNPNQIGSFDVATGLNSANSYSGKVLYISSDNDEVENEVGLNMINFAERVQPACIQGEECKEGLPVKTCSDNLIIIREKNTSSIRQENGCVYIEGQKDELVKVADEFLFRILEIKK